MTVLRSIDGKFYDVPDSKLTDYAVSDEAIDAFFSDLDEDESEDPGPPDEHSDAPQVVIYVTGGDDAFDPGPPVEHDGF